MTKTNREEKSERKNQKKEKNNTSNLKVASEQKTEEEIKVTN